MLKFFKKQRIHNLQAEKTRKYFAYIIGEIVLVAVGVLIALQVNNWNDELKNDKIELKALIDLKKEFESNKKQFHQILNIKQNVLKKNRTYINVLKDKKDAEIVIQARFGLGDGGIQTFNPSSGVLNTLINTGTINAIYNDSLKYILTEWKDLVLDYKEEEDRHEKFFMEVFIPYEFTLVPRPYFLNGEPNFPFHNNSTLKNMFSIVKNDLKYQNLVLANEGFLESTIKESKILENLFEEIGLVLDSEINNNSK